MKYISNNQELINIVKQFYLQEVSALDVGTVYFKYKLYSAASTYYNIHLQDIRNKTYIENYNEIKSYCFSQMALCYYYQQKDFNYSQWQLEMIRDLCEEAIIYNSNNIYAYLILGNVYYMFRNNKEAYFKFKYVILHLNTLPKLLDSIFYKDLFNMILKIFDLAEEQNIIFTDEIIKCIYQFISSHNYYTYNHIKQINDQITKHYNLEEIEVAIMNGTF